MDPERRRAFNIEVHYAFTQLFYFVAVCCLESYTALFLADRGLNNSEIGLTVALTSIGAILLQLWVSDFCDKHPGIPLKRITVLMYAASFAFVAVLYAARPGVALTAVLFVLAAAPERSDSGLLNALMIQYVNTGLPVNYGWPRGVGSLGAALASLVLGVLVAKNGSDILLPIFMGTAAVAMLCMSLMPPVGASPYVKKKAVRASSYGEMLKSNRALVLFLISVVVLGIGQAPVWTFINRLIESLGGSAKEQGVVIMIQSGMELPAMFMSGLLLRRFRPHQLVRFSFASYALKSLLFLLSGSTGMLYAAAMLGFSCFGFYGFAGVMYANEIVPEPDQKVRAQSLISLAFSGGIGGVLGNAAGGVILDSFGLRALLIFSVVLSALSLLFMSLSVKALKDAEGRAR